MQKLFYFCHCNLVSASGSSHFSSLSLPLLPKGKKTDSESIVFSNVEHVSLRCRTVGIIVAVCLLSRLLTVFVLHCSLVVGRSRYACFEWINIVNVAKLFRIRVMLRVTRVLCFSLLERKGGASLQQHLNRNLHCRILPTSARILRLFSPLVVLSLRLRLLLCWQCPYCWMLPLSFFSLFFFLRNVVCAAIYSGASVQIESGSVEWLLGVTSAVLY